MMKFFKLKSFFSFSKSVKKNIHRISKKYGIVGDAMQCGERKYGCIFHIAKGSFFLSKLTVENKKKEKM